MWRTLPQSIWRYGKIKLRQQSGMHVLPVSILRILPEVMGHLALVQPG